MALSGLRAGKRTNMGAGQVALRPLPAEVEQQDQHPRGFHYALMGNDVLISQASTSARPRPALPSSSRRGLQMVISMPTALPLAKAERPLILVGERELARHVEFVTEPIANADSSS